MRNINLKEIRKNKGYTQKEIAKLLEIPQQQYSRYETGINKIPLEMFLKIIDACHLKIEIKEK